MNPIGECKSQSERSSRMVVLGRTGHVVSFAEAGHMNAVLWLLLCLMSGTAAFRTLAPAMALHLQLKPRGLASRRLRYLPTKLCAKCDVEFLREMLPEGTNVAHKLMDLEATNVALARKLSDQYRLWANGSVDIPTACVMSRIYASVRKFGKAATVLKESAETNPGATVPEDAWRWLLLAARQEKLFVIAKKIVQTVHELYGDRPIPGDLYVLLVDCAAAVPESKFAVMVFELAREFNAEVPLEAYRRAFELCLKDNKPSCATSIFEHLQQSKHPPDYTLYKLYRDCLKRSAAWDKVHEMTEEMERLFGPSSGPSSRPVNRQHPPRPQTTRRRIVADGAWQPPPNTCQS